VWCRTGIDFTQLVFNERLILPVVTDVDFSQNPETQSQKRGCTVLRVIGQAILIPSIQRHVDQMFAEIAVGVWGIDNEERVQDTVGGNIGDIGPDTIDWFDRDYFGWVMDGYTVRRPLESDEQDVVLTARSDPLIRFTWDMQIRRRMSGDDNLFLAVQPTNGGTDDPWSVAAYAQALIQLPGA